MEATKITMTVSANANVGTMAGERMIKIMEEAEFKFGFDTIVSSTFDAIFNFVHRELMLNIEAADTEDDQTVAVLKDVSNKVYDLCEKGKMEVEMIEAYRRRTLCLHK